MADFPCLPLWTDAYLGDTQHLTTEEHGAYLLLLIQAWRTPSCALPDNDDLLARHAKLSKAKWKSAKPIVMAFWTLDHKRNVWVQKRLREERKKVAERKRKAKDSAASRWNKTKSDDANGYANASSKQCSPTPTPTYEKPSGFSKSASAEKPKGFVEIRKTGDAVRTLIEEIRNDGGRIGGGDDIDRENVLLLPAVGGSRS